MAKVSQFELLLGGLRDTSGQPLAGGKVYTYSAGTTSNKTTYQTNDTSTPHANPIVLDSNGRRQVYGSGAYKLRIDSSTNVTLYTFDNLWFGEPDGTTFFGGISTGAANTYVITPSPAIDAYTDGQIFVFQAHQTNTSTATLNANGKGAKTVSSTAGQIVSGVTYMARYNSVTDQFNLLNPSLTWQTWVPTYGAGGTMTYTTVTTTQARYLYDPIAKTVDFTLTASGTTGGVANNSITATLPITAAAAGRNNFMALLTDGGTIYSGADIINTTTLSIRRDGGTATWALGASRAFTVSGRYEAA